MLRLKALSSKPLPGSGKPVYKKSNRNEAFKNMYEEKKTGEPVANTEKKIFTDIIGSVAETKNIIPGKSIGKEKL